MIDTGVQTGDGTGIVVGNLPAAVSPLPVFSVQPGASVLYQDGGRVQSSAATVSPATSMQWQRKQTDGSWSDVTGQTGNALDMAAGNASHAGTYRLRVTNGNSVAFSSDVTTYFVYMGIQNDSSPTNGSSTGTTKVSNFVYSEDGPSGLRYYSAFYKTVADDANFIPPGASSARAPVTWTTSAAAVAPINSVSASGQLTTSIKPGSAVLTAAIGNLSSVVNINFT